jgi:hypothetical protein
MTIDIVNITDNESVPESYDSEHNREQEFIESECNSDNSIAYFIYSKSGLKYLTHNFYNIIYYTLYAIGYIVFKFVDIYISLSSYIKFIMAMLIMIIIVSIGIVSLISTSYCSRTKCFFYDAIVYMIMPVLSLICIVVLVSLSIILIAKIYVDINACWIKYRANALCRDSFIVQVV